MTNFVSMVLRGVMTLISGLPLPIARRLGGGVAWLCLKMETREVRVTRQNIALCYPDLAPLEQDRFVTNSFHETGKTAVEICHVWMRSAAWLERHICHIHHGDLVRQAQQDGKGVLFLAPHIGNWEVFGAHLASYGAMKCLYQPPKQAALEKLVYESRQRHNMEAVPTTSRGISAILKHLRSGGITGILPDQCPVEGAGEFSPFFNQPAYTMTMIHRLIEKTGCCVIFGMAARVPKGFDIHFIAADNEIYSEDQPTSLAALNRGVESCIAIAPEQYQWEYKRFKKFPPSEQDPYKRKLNEIQHGH